MRTRVVDQIIDRLLEHIEENHLEKGDRMPSEKEVCEMMDVGRSTVREAYKVMQAREIVTSRQGKGVFVEKTLKDLSESGNPFGNQEMRIQDYMDVRTAIETTAVRLAIKSATEEQIAELERIQTELDQSVRAGDVWRMASMDERFHSTIARMTNNPLMIQVDDIVSRAFKKFRLRSFKSIENRVHAIPKHAMIIQAFRERNCDLGVLVMNQHLQESYDDIMALIEEERDQQ